jgi:MFS transporter, ACS family, aldohexuronate transporter
VQTQTTNPWRLLGFATLVQMGVSIVDLGLPQLNGFIKAELGVSAAVAGFAVASFAFGKIFGSYAAGNAADRLGERRVIVTGAVLVGILTAIAAALPDWLIFEVLFLAGLAASTSTPAGGRLVLMAFPRRRHGLALSLRQCGIPAGGLVASSVLPWLAHVWSWRWALAIAGAITVATVLPLAFEGFEPEPSDPRHRHGTSTPSRDRNVRLITIWGCLIVTSQYTVLAFFALDLHERTGLSLVHGSLLVGLANLVGLFGRIFWGTLSDRLLWLGRKPLLLTMNAMGLVTALAMLATPRSAPITVYVVLAALAGFAMIGYQGLWITALAEAAGPRRVGAATGFALTFTQTAIALTPPVFGFVADQAGSYRAVWGALSIVLALALVPGSLVHERVERR